jgi:hypothetical protein
MSKITTLKPYWIIVNWDKRSIWQRPYETYDAARRELTKQEMGFPEHSWVIEQRESYVEVDVSGLDEYSKF